MTINDRVKEIRKSKGMNQDEFAQVLGISKAGVQKIEYSKSNVSEATRRSICREFGVSKEWLEDGVGDMYISCEDQEFVTISGIAANGTDAQKTLMRFIAGMDEKLLEALVEYAHDFFKE